MMIDGIDADAATGIDIGAGTTLAGEEEQS